MKAIALWFCSACILHAQLHVQHNDDGSVTIRPSASTARTAVTDAAPVWDKPVMAEVSLLWDLSPDAVSYRIEQRSSKTTNEWIRVATVPQPNNTNQALTASVMLDLSVPVWTRIIAIGENRSESKPTNPVKHPAINPPKPPGQHRHMYSRTQDEAVLQRRSRSAPTPVLPPLPGANPPNP